MTPLNFVERYYYNDDDDGRGEIILTAGDVGNAVLIRPFLVRRRRRSTTLYRNDRDAYLLTPCHPDTIIIIK